MNLTLEALGLTQEEIEDRVVNRIVEHALRGVAADEDGEEVSVPTPFARRLDDLVKGAIDARVSAIAEAHVLPKVTAMVENIVLQETTSWGEKRGAPMSFIEYLVKRAEHYLTEPVDYNGKSKEESRDSYNWSKSQTRIAALVHGHLHYSIETAMKKAVADANAAIVGGLAETVKVKLEEVAKKLKVTVAT